MSSQKASPDNELEQPLEGDPPATGLEDLQSHISQRINQLQTPDEIVSEDGLLEGSSEDVLLGVSLNTIGESGIIPPFEPFEGYEFAALHGAEPSYPGRYEKMREVYPESGEVIKSLHSLSDQITESLLNLNVRLNGLEGKLKDLSDVSNDELRKLKLLIREVHKAIPDPVSTAKSGDQNGGSEQSIQAFRDELQKQMNILKERLERHAAETGGRTEERQTNFLNGLDARVKILEKSSTGFKDTVNKSFFNVALLFILIVIIAGTIITFSVDRMTSYVSQGLDALRTTVREAAESSHSAGTLP